MTTCCRWANLGDLVLDVIGQFSVGLEWPPLELLKEELAQT